MATQYKPFFEVFTLFSQLPIEIRVMIWKLTVKPRFVELRYDAEHGFYSRVETPIALRVCKDSRDAVVKYYPLCFGNFRQRPNIIFNFSMDTLLFDYTMQPSVIHFLLGLTKHEREHIQYIAVDNLIDKFSIPAGINSPSDESCLEWFKDAVRSMPAIKEFAFYWDLCDECSWHDHGFPEGSGTIELFEDFPYEIQEFIYRSHLHLDDEDAMSECQELPICDHLNRGFEVPTKSLFGWRSMKLDELLGQVSPWSSDSEDGDGAFSGIVI